MNIIHILEKRFAIKVFDDSKYEKALQNRLRKLRIFFQLRCTVLKMPQQVASLKAGQAHVLRVHAAFCAPCALKLTRSTGFAKPSISNLKKTIKDADSF